MKTPRTIVAYGNADLRELVKEHMAAHGPACSLNHIDVSTVQNFSHIFQDIAFCGDVSEWDVSNATQMNALFAGSAFNGDISRWNVSSVQGMELMFARTPFNGDISQWDVSSVQRMDSMFTHTPFNSDISKWNTGALESASCMFDDAQFNGDLSQWDMSKVESMAYMFRGSSFQGDISNWDVARVLSFYGMFEDTHYCGDLSRWNWRGNALMDQMFDEPSTVPVCMYHWYVALECDDPDYLAPEHQAFYETNRELVASLCSSRQEMREMFNALWIQRQDPALRQWSDLALPDLADQPGLGGG